MKGNWSLILAALLALAGSALTGSSVSPAQPAPPPSPATPPGSSVSPAQPAPPPSPAAPPGPSLPWSHEAEKAQKELAKARYLAGLVRAGALKREADTLLAQAEQEFRAGAYFRAKERAEAAAKVYKAQRFLDLGGYPYPYKESYEDEESYEHEESYEYKKAYEAPFRAQKALTKAEFEAKYYQVVSPTINRLLQEARRLLANPTGAQAQAAYELAEAAQHLIKAERGF